MIDSYSFEVVLLCQTLASEFIQWLLSSICFPTLIVLLNSKRRNFKGIAWNLEALESPVFAWQPHSEVTAPIHEIVQFKHCMYIYVYH